MCHLGLDRFAEDIMRTLQQYYDAHETHETHMTTVLECKQRNSFFILNGCILVSVANKKGQGQNCQSDVGVTPPSLTDIRVLGHLVHRQN